LVLSVLVRI